MKNLSLKSAKRAFTLVEIMIVVLIIGILLAIAVPNFIRAREQSRAKSCSANLKQIDSAKQQYAMDNGVKGGDVTPITLVNLTTAGTGYLRSIPVCPSTNKSTDYTPGSVDVLPICANSVPVTYPHTVDGK